MGNVLQKQKRTGSPLTAKYDIANRPAGPQGTGLVRPSIPAAEEASRTLRSPRGPGETIAPLNMIRASMACSSLPQRTPTPTGDNPACCSSSRGLVEGLANPNPSLQRSPVGPCCGAPLAPPAFLLLYPISGAPRRRRSTQQPALFVMLPKAKTGMPAPHPKPNANHYISSLSSAASRMP